MSNFPALVEAIIQSEVKGAPMHEHVLELGHTSDTLIQEAGFPELKLAIKASTVAKICFDHGLPTSMIKRLPDIVNSPKSIYHPADPRHIDSVVVMTFEIKGTVDPVIIPIRKNVRIGRNNRYNVITSAYGKEGGDPERKWTSNGLLIWKAI